MISPKRLWQGLKNFIHPKFLDIDEGRIEQALKAVRDNLRALKHKKGEPLTFYGSDKHGSHMEF